MMRRWMVCALCLLPGCFPVRPGSPLSGSGPVPQRRQEVKPLAISDIPPLATADTTTKIVPAADPMVKPAGGIEPDAIGQLHAASLEKFGTMSSFVARLKRRESPAGRSKPEDLILFKERKTPTSVHFKWIGPEANGREVLYVRGQHGDKLNIVTAAGDIPFTAAGQRMALARDSLLVRAANPNHDITDCGMAYNLKDLGMLFQAARNPASGVMARSLGMVTRPESPVPMPGIEIRLPSGRDPDLPKGGSRQIYYCPKARLPVLFVCFDETGREQNYNYYDRLQLDLQLDDDDFNPDKLWGKPATTDRVSPTR